MKIRAALFYKSCIAFYSIYLIQENLFKAKLDYYRGESSPPLLVQLHKNKHSWNSNCQEEEVVKELGAAIEQNQEVFYHRTL
jgi:hypothetical protein